MFAKAFNPKRPFGTVNGIPGVAYDQDGQLYNFQHQPVDLDGKVMDLAAAPEPAPEPEPAPAAAKAPAAPAVIGEDDDTLEEDKVDLRAWAMGDPAAAATPWQSVREAAGLVLDDITELKSKAALKEALLKHYGVAA